MSVCRYPTWVFKLPWPEITEASELWNLEPITVAAVIQTESAGNQWAQRYESSYNYLYHVSEYARALELTYTTVEAAQKTSYGLMQIMYAVALERGFQGYPGELYDVKKNLDYGCKHLKLMATKVGTDPEKLYAVYNGGLGVLKSLKETGQFRNKSNVDRFMRNYRKLTKLF